MKIETGCGIMSLVLLLAAIPAWITHVVVSIQTEQWVLLVVGALVAPVGVIHGFGIWLGLF